MPLVATAAGRTGCTAAASRSRAGPCRRARSRGRARRRPGPAEADPASRAARAATRRSGRGTSPCRSALPPSATVAVMFGDLGFELLVVGDERLERRRVLLRVAPAAVLARGEQPAHQPRHEHRVVAAPDEAVEHERRRRTFEFQSHASASVVELLDVRAIALDPHRVRDAAEHVVVARAALVRRGHRVGQIRQREDRQPIGDVRPAA